MLRYQPTDEPLDYLVAFQAGFVQRLFEKASNRRFDFAPAQDDEIGPAKRQQLTFEIAMKGQNGLDINDPAPKYTLDLLPGKFSGMQLVSMMYARLKQIDPNMDAVIALMAEYEAALAMRQNKNV